MGDDHILAIFVSRLSHFRQTNYSVSGSGTGVFVRLNVFGMRNWPTKNFCGHDLGHAFNDLNALLARLD